MPVILKEGRDPTTAAGVVSLISEDTGELTLEAQALNDLLTILDFDSVWQLPGIRDFVVEAEERELDEDGEPAGDPVATHILLGPLLAQLIDEDDLGHVAEIYACLLAEAAEDAGLEEKARVAALFDALDIELDEAKKKNPFKPPYKKGTFKKLHKRGKAMGHRAVRSMLAMIHKGVIKRKGDSYTKGAGYRKGGTPAGKKKVALYKGKSAAKQKKAAKKALAASTALPFDFDALDEAPVYGFGVPIGEALFAVGVVENAEAVLAAFKEKMGGETGIDGYKAALAEQTTEEPGDESGEGKAPKKEKRPTEESAQPKQRSAISEGAGMAGKILDNFASRGIIQEDENPGT